MSPQEIVTTVVHLQCKQLTTSMLSMLDNWGVYDEVYTKLSLDIARYMYHLENCKRSAVSLNALKCQIKILQVNLLKFSYSCTSFCTFNQPNKPH